MTRRVLLDLPGRYRTRSRSCPKPDAPQLRVEPIADSAVRALASPVAHGLLRIGFGLLPTDDAYAAMRQEFLDLYASRLTTSSNLYPGTVDELDSKKAMALCWGVVINRPIRFTEPLP